ncbi:MAG: hypothetical protein KatS3mg055_3691 [Chloroflexus sp.]|uniref:spermidine synthase n=1 Tax=Chloroflexus sp. TaxID=1904827 RepID=UPI0021DE3087|nr:hypothetical protein [Chloroflexus sp.]GIV91173.1 MAG: hypothetical protein KatS3mg055_3691 [Chloroflexus sp.]
MKSYTSSIFLSAFLIFQVQPMIAHYILPWFGGTNSVWSAVVLFFQLMLVGGYLYADWLSKAIAPERQWRIHGALLGIAAGLILVLGFVWPAPVIPSASWKPSTAEQPVLYIFFLLTISVGLPYFILASNSPLIQSWFAHTQTGRSPYWLYALSNAGSLFGLLSYPVLIEPSLRLGEQGWLWSGLYLLFAALTFAIVWQLRRLSYPQAVQPKEGVHIAAPTEITLIHRLLWLTLSAITSVMMLVVTTRLTQDIAPVPMLWILPLTIYLLSFIIAFAGEQYYHRQAFLALLTLTSIGLLFIPLIPNVPIILQIVLNLLFLFATCMTAHGEVYRLRPSAQHLTHFYLLISIGGAVGGIIVNFIAPLVFNDYWEFYIGWIITYLLLLFLGAKQLNVRQRQPIILLGATATVMSILIGYVMIINSQTAIWSERNFYGVLRVIERDNVHLLVHGTTIHGAQYIAADKRDNPIGYYGPDSGIALALQNHPRYGQGIKVGLVGLGVGVLAAYGQKHDIYRFYEINPLVIDLANGAHGFFSFLPDSQARAVTIEIIPGDARLSLEDERNRGETQGYDILVVDAFSSDTIPVHLLTQEALELYLHHLAPDGILVIHITNRHLDLTPLIWTSARQLGLYAGIIRNNIPQDEQTVIFPSVWALLARQPTLLSQPALAGKVDTLEQFSSNLRPWTDDYSNIFQLLRGWRFGSDS